MTDARSRARAALSGPSLRRPPVAATSLPGARGPAPVAHARAVAAFEMVDPYGLDELLTVDERAALAHDAERALFAAACAARELREALDGRRTREALTAGVQFRDALAHAALASGRVR